MDQGGADIEDRGVRALQRALASSPRVRIGVRDLLLELSRSMASRPAGAEQIDLERLLHRCLARLSEQGLIRLPAKFGKTRLLDLAVTRIQAPDRHGSGLNGSGLTPPPVCGRAPSAPARAGIAWRAKMAWAATDEGRAWERDLDLLLAINAAITPPGALRLPIKERSLEIFGDEKRLDALLGPDDTLFRGRVTLADIGAERIRIPIAGVRVRPGGRALVVENKDPWSSCVIAAREGFLPYDVIWLGMGSQILQATEDYLDADTIDYWGDIDPAGIEILATLQDRTGGRVRPATDLYAALITKATRAGPALDERKQARTVSGLDGALRAEMDSLIASGKRLAQEALSMRHLCAGLGSVSGSGSAPEETPGKVSVAA